MIPVDYHAVHGGRMNILVVHGPNLNMLGIREPAVYGSMTLNDLNQRLQTVAESLGVALECFQSNHEGAILDLLHAKHATGLTGCVMNPGGLTHTSIVLLDAIKSVDFPVIEVHISNVAAREEFRRHSYISQGALGTIAGLGWKGYELAIRALVDRTKNN